MFSAGCQSLGGSDSSGSGNSGSGSGGSGAVSGGNAANRQVIKHVVVMFQENHSFDSYFGGLGAYRAANNIPGTVDGFAPGARYQNPNYDRSGVIDSFHLATTCIENVSPAWNESHVQFNLDAPSGSVGLQNGFVYSAAKFARDLGFTDIEGERSMGYYDERDIPYYYFMASQFATSDRWFSSALTRTQPNRMYSFAATSEGWTRPPDVPMAGKSIFHLLQEKGVSWKIYVADYDPNPEYRGTYLRYFGDFYTQNVDKIVPLSQYKLDAQAGTLPAVAWIESGYSSGTDEHPDNHIDVGAAFAAEQINTLMNSVSWKDSAFFLTYDEGGGLYDHVPPPAAVHPDGIAPKDIPAGEIVADFDRYGFRVPVLVVSPYSRKNYVSHTVMDFTAILRFIELQNGLPSLTRRDASQPDMAEFFDFNNPAFLVPPVPPAQPVDLNKCNNQILK